MTSSAVVASTSASGEPINPPSLLPSASQMDESRSRFAEALDVIEGLWSNDVFSYGAHFRLDELSLQPRPIESPPPIWVAAVSPETFEMTGELEDPSSPRPR